MQFPVSFLPPSLKPIITRCLPWPDTPPIWLLSMSSMMFMLFILLDHSAESGTIHHAPLWDIFVIWVPEHHISFIFLLLTGYYLSTSFACSQRLIIGMPQGLVSGSLPITFLDISSSFMFLISSVCWWHPKSYFSPWPLSWTPEFYVQQATRQLHFID